MVLCWKKSAGDTITSEMCVWDQEDAMQLKKITSSKMFKMKKGQDDAKDRRQHGSCCHRCLDSPAVKPLAVIKSRRLFLARLAESVWKEKVHHVVQD
jgi:hypothetical protein